MNHNPLKVCDPADYVSSSNSPHPITKWSKRPGKGDEEGKFGAHALPISGRSPRDLGCLLALADPSMNPDKGSPLGAAFSHERGTAKPQSRAHRLLLEGVSFILTGTLQS